MNEVLKKIKKENIISITGGGGKTSLIFFLAEELAKQGKVLITTTTKIYLPKTDDYEEMYIENKIIKGNNKNIFIVGKNILNNNKLEGLPLNKLKELKKEYDYILIEADGAKRKLMKGWKKTEPVIPNFTNIVIGVVNLDILGKKMIESNIHRLRLFLEKTQGTYGKIIDENILEKYIKTGDFFKGFRGEKIIFLNGIENIDKLNKGINLGKKIKNLYFGSIKNKWISKTKSIDAVIMASGYSKRFEGDKLFEKINDIPMIEHTLRKLKEIAFNKIIIVGRDKRIKKLCKKYKYKYIKNNKAYLGQSESIKRGLLKSNGDAIMFFTGDQPFLTKPSILRLIKEYEKNNKIIKPVVGETPCSPVIFPQQYKKQLLKLQGDTGGRKLLRKENIVYKVNFKDDNEFIDIDTREELKRIKDIINFKNKK